VSAGIVVYSSSELIAGGLAGLLSDEWGDRIAVASELDALADPRPWPLAGAIIDADARGAREAIRWAKAQGGAAVLLLGPSSSRLDQTVLDEADAVLHRDAASPLLIRVALVVGRLGMRVVPRDESPPTVVDAGGVPLTDPAWRALALLAAGMRDAEIARELYLSESAVRKLVQRTMRSLGARTRCQAVAIAARERGLTAHSRPRAVVALPPGRGVGAEAV
jgi:hypothetical protein